MTDKQYRIKLLTIMSKMLKLEWEICDLIDGRGHEKERQLDEHGRARSAYMINFHGFLNAIYAEYAGAPELEVYGRFGTIDSDKPVAWYSAKKRWKGDEAIPGPKMGRLRATGFIPDEINTVILSRSLAPEIKNKLLSRMFKDLAKIQAKFNKKMPKLPPKTSELDVGPRI